MTGEPGEALGCIGGHNRAVGASQLHLKHAFFDHETSKNRRGFTPGDFGQDRGCALEGCAHLFHLWCRHLETVTHGGHAHGDELREGNSHGHLEHKLLGRGGLAHVNKIATKSAVVDPTTHPEGEPNRWVSCPPVALVVEKFGGTSVADASRIAAVADHVMRRRQHGDEVVLVVSAMGSETDQLLRLAAEVSSNPPERELDMLITGGERKACALMAMAISALGTPAASLTGSQAGFLTDGTHTNAKILRITPDRVRDCLAEGVVPIVGGSQGVSAARDVTFLGRGGSDTTAVALAHAIDADLCELYTDVPGVFTADPRLVGDASLMKTISFDELLEMTASGCPKPAMRAVELARTYDVELHVRSAFTWVGGTIVTGGKAMEHAIISAVTHDTSEAKMTVSGVADKPGVAGRLFRALADRDVNVDMIVQNVSAQGVTDISFTVPISQLPAAREVVDGLKDVLEATHTSGDDDIARVSLIGAGMQTNPGVAAHMFETLAAAGINIEMISTSAIRISCVIRAAGIERAVNALHEAFELHKAPEDRSVFA